jgi:hypothetical protein
MGLGMSRSKRGDTQIVKFPSSLLILLSAVSLMGVLPVAASGQQPGDAAQSSSNQPAPQHQPVPSQQAPPSKDNQREDPGKSKNSDKIEPEGVSKDRLFYALPNFLTLENAGQVPPLSSKEKFKVVAKGSFDYVQIPWYAFLAGISQAENSEAGYGQGAAGYGKRFGAYFVDGTIENFMAGAILPTVFKQDPRYFQSGEGSFAHRTGYAMSRMFVTRTDSGHQQFNYSEIFGSAISAGISTYTYHPHEDKTLSNTLSVWGSQVGYDTMTVVLKEFWPDIRRKLKKDKQTQ